MPIACVVDAKKTIEQLKKDVTPISSLAQSRQAPVSIVEGHAKGRNNEKRKGTEIQPAAAKHRAMERKDKDSDVAIMSLPMPKSGYEAPRSQGSGRRMIGLGKVLSDGMEMFVWDGM